MPDPLDFGPLALLAPASRAALHAASAERTFARGEEILREGGPPDAAFAIVRGRVRVTAAGLGTLATLGAPALVGELAVLSGEPRTATVTAASAVRAIRIPREAIREAVTGEPAFAEELTAFAALRSSTNYLRRSSPFADLPSATIDELAAQLRSERLAPGDVLMREGEEGDDAFLLRSGELEVVRGSDAGGRVVGTLSPGALFGEISVLTGVPRHATVRARSAASVFRIPGDAVRPIVRRHRRLLERLEKSMEARHRPMRTGPATVAPAPDDESSVIVRSDAEGTYLRLSRDALAIYEALDGERTLRELVLDHFERTGALDPQGVLSTVTTLQAAGLVSAPRVALLDRDRDRVGRIVDAILTPRLELADADPLATALHRAVRPLIGPLGAAAALIVGAVGSVGIGITFHAASPGDFGAGGLLVAFLGLALAGIGHEAAHAIATKAVGRRVGHAGIGLLYFTPVIYVDTSDAWLVDRHRRALVNAVGPLFNFALAGVLGILALVGTPAGSAAQDVAIWLGVVNLASVAFNLSPFLEFDGYYVLSDLLNVNALRSTAFRLAFLELPRDRRLPATRLERGLVAYVAAVILYVLAIAVASLAGIPQVLDGILAGRVTAEAREAVAIVASAIICLLIVAPLVGEIGRVRRERRG